jgi:hypothetical protein
MKHLFQLLLSVFFIIPFVSCAPSHEEKAVAKLSEAQSVLSQGDTLRAIGVLESIPVLFPKAVAQVEISKSKADELFRQLINAKKEQLSDIEIQITELEKNFTKEKTEFDMYVQYVPKKLSFSYSWSKSFLQVNLDERGEIFLTSNYMGKEWLKHTAIKIYDGGLQIKTPSVSLDDPNNRESDFIDYKWEKVSYTQGKSDSTIMFIVKNCNRQLKCAFMGVNYYYIILDDFNKEAIKEAYDLSLAIKNKALIKRQIKELEGKR